MKLNLGCGNQRRTGFIGVDLYPCAGVDVICDLRSPLPFNENSIEEFYLDNVIEHVPNIPAVVTEIVRVCKSGATGMIITPHFSSLASWRDPTHLHHLSYFSLDHFEKLSTRHYVGGGLRVLGRGLSFGGGALGLLGRLLFWCSPEKYERKYCFIFRASTLRFQVQVVK